MLVVGDQLPQMDFQIVLNVLQKNVKMNACCTSNNGRVEGNSCVIKALVRKTGDDSYQQIETWYPMEKIEKTCK